MSPDARLAVVLVAELSVAFAVKHYAADFLFQTSWMARGKEKPRHWVPALAVHALCHGALTLLILAVVSPRLWWLAMADLVVHFAIDRGKAVIATTSRWQPSQPQFWWLLGFDQMLHQLTNVALVLAIMLL